VPVWIDPASTIVPRPTAVAVRAVSLSAADCVSVAPSSSRTTIRSEGPYPNWLADTSKT